MATYPRTYVTDETHETNETNVAFLTERSRPSREQKTKRTNAGKTWADHSEKYPDELKTASRRINLLEAKGLDHEELCAALAVYARIPDLNGQPHHAIGFTEYVARTFIAKMREERRAEEKRAEATSESARPDRSLHRLDVSAVLAQMRAG